MITLYVKDYFMNVITWLLTHFPAQSGNIWQSGWQGGANDGNQPQTTTQQHQAGNHAEEQFSDMFRMLDPPVQDFNDLSGMFPNFTEWEKTDVRVQAVFINRVLVCL